jgi:hypothetical protein
VATVSIGVRGCGLSTPDPRDHPDLLHVSIDGSLHSVQSALSILALAERDVLAKIAPPAMWRR